MTIIGWVVAAILSVLSGLLLKRLSEKERSISWRIKNIAPILDSSISDEYVTSWNVELAITNKSTKIENLHLIDVEVKNTGTDILSDGIIDLVFLNKAQCLRARINGVGHSYKRKLKLAIDRINRKYELKFDFMDPGQTIELELLVTDFKVDEFEVDCSLPSLMVSREGA